MTMGTMTNSNSRQWQDDMIQHTYGMCVKQWRRYWAITPGSTSYYYTKVNKVKHPFEPTNSC